MQCRTANRRIHDIHSGTCRSAAGGCCPWWRLSVFCLLVLGGCGSVDREALEGTVTLDGHPLAAGYISFRPQPGTAGPTAGAEISNGRFAIPAQQGTFAGSFRVEITAMRKTGRKVMDDFSGRLIDACEQFLPARYNNQSELTARVRAGQPNEFEFAVSSR